MAQRISRAKRRIAGLPPDQPGDLATVLRVLCLVFNEGHSGDVDLAAEAVRLTRQLAALTGEPEAAGLPALMLLHRARRASRAGPGAAWCRPASRTAHAGTLARDRLGEYQAQAAIAALHADAPSAAETDWVQVTGWYDELPRLARRGAALSRRP